MQQYNNSSIAFSKADDVHKKAYLHGLDGLRALAIAGVFFYHLSPAAVPGGFLGVSLFFALTGYLMVVSCQSAWQKNQFGVLSFYKKRLRRIYPALLLTILAALCVSVFLLPEASRSSWSELASILFGYNNWWQIAQNASYFTKITNASPFTHLWFLAVELQFYLFWPFFFLLYKRAKTPSARQSILFLLLTLAAASGLLMFLLYQPGQDPSRVYYGTDTRIFALLLGAALAIWQGNRSCPAISAAVCQKRTIAALACLLAAAALFFVMDGQQAGTYTGGMFLASLLFTALLAFVTDDRLPVGRWLDNRILVWLGQRSYEIYLCLYPVFYYFNFRGLTADIWYWALLQILLTLLLAAIMHAVTSRTSLSALLQPHISRWHKTIAASVLVVSLILGGYTLSTVPASNVSDDEKQLQQELEQNQLLLQQQMQTAVHAADQRPAIIGPVQPVTPLPFLPPLEKRLPKAPEGTITVIGDSVMLGAAPVLQKTLPNCIINAQESRQVYTAMDSVRQLNIHGQLGKTVILELGTNGAFTTADAQTLLDYLGTERTIYWITSYGKHLSWQKQVNNEIHNLAQQYANLHVIDWASVAPSHPDWFYKDGIHLNNKGKTGYAQLIASHVPHN